MTEYNYSPAAIRAYQEKQAQISQWASHTSKHEKRHGHLNPFAPSDTPRHSDFYAKPSTPSEIYGPDRPPSPPRSAPVGFGMGNPYGGHAVNGYGHTGGYTAAQGPSATLRPTWNGYAWVYTPTPSPQPQSQQPRLVRPSSGSSSRRDQDYHDSHRRRDHDRRSSHGPRDRRRSVSNPPASAPPISYDVNGARVSILSVPNSAGVQTQSFAIPTPQVWSPGHSYRSASMGSAQVIYSGGYGQQPLASPQAYAGAPIVMVDSAPRRSGKLRKSRY